MDGVFTLPEVGPRLRDEDFVLRPVRDGSSGDSGRESRRLIFPAIASDGLPEPEVIASAVGTTVAIDSNPTPEIRITPAPVPTDWNGIDAFLAGSPLAGMGNTFIAGGLLAIEAAGEFERRVVPEGVAQVTGFEPAPPVWDEWQPGPLDATGGNDGGRGLPATEERKLDE